MPVLMNLRSSKGAYIEWTEKDLIFSFWINLGHFIYNFLSRMSYAEKHRIFFFQFTLTLIIKHLRNTLECKSHVNMHGQTLCKNSTPQFHLQNVTPTTQGPFTVHSVFCLFFFFLLFSFSFLFSATLSTYRSSQARSRIRAAATGLIPQPLQHQIWATSATYAKACSHARPLTHWARPGIEPTPSWRQDGVLNPLSPLCLF